MHTIYSGTKNVVKTGEGLVEELHVNMDIKQKTSPILTWIG